MTERAVFLIFFVLVHAVGILHGFKISVYHGPDDFNGLHTRGTYAVECVTAHLRWFDEDFRSGVVFCFDERSIVSGHRLVDVLSVPLRRSWFPSSLDFRVLRQFGLFPCRRGQFWARVLRPFPSVCISGRSSLVFTASLVSAFFSQSPCGGGRFWCATPSTLEL